MEWKDIPGFEGLYQISDDGTIISLPRNYKYGVIDKPTPLKTDTSRGYLRVTLHKNGKKYKHISFTNKCVCS